MSNLLTVLKDEIRRVARKEIRAQVSATKRSAAQHRRDIAKMKRHLIAQERRLAALEAGSGKRQAGGSPAGVPAEEVRFSARSVRAQRRRLNLSAEKFAKLLGVSAQTVYNWELGKVRPREAQMATLVAIRSLHRRDALSRLRSLPE